MKKLVIGGLLIGAFAFAGTAAAMTVGKTVIQSQTLWGFVAGKLDTTVYRLNDVENGVVCYFAYYSSNTSSNYVLEMSCVKIR